jgi:hypothetical protein
MVASFIDADARAVASLFRTDVRAVVRHPRFVRVVAAFIRVHARAVGSLFRTVAPSIRTAIHVVASFVHAHALSSARSRLDMLAVVRVVTSLIRGHVPRVVPRRPCSPPLR